MGEFPNINLVVEIGMDGSGFVRVESRLNLHLRSVSVRIVGEC